MAPDTIALTLPLANFCAGKITLLVAHDGAPEDTVDVISYARRTRVESFDLHAGDDFGTLNGSQLDEVASLALGDVTFTPGTLARAKDRDALRMLAEGAAADWKPGQSLSGRVRFIDGRPRAFKATIGVPRPMVTLVGKSVALPTAKSPVLIKLADAEQLPA